MKDLVRRVLSVAILMMLLLIPAVQAPEARADQSLTITYRYSFPEPFVDVSTPERTYVIEGLELDGRGGVPRLPVASISLAIPPGHRLTGVEVATGEPRVLAYRTTYPVNPAETSMDGSAVCQHRYERSAWRVIGTHYVEGVQVLGLTLHPLSWDEGTGALSFIEHYKVTIRYEESPTLYPGDMGRVRGIVDNPQVVHDLASSVPMTLLRYGDYEHLIITTEELSAPFLALSEWKRHRNELGSVHENIKSTVVTLEDILSDSRFWGNPRSHGNTGNDTQTILRNFLVAAHREWGVEYVLLGGDDDVIPTRMVHAPVYDTEYKLLAADIYYSGLDGDWDADGDGIYGEIFGNGLSITDEADLLAEVFVGRATVSTPSQAWNFVNKTISYERGYSNQYGDDILLIGEKLDDRPTYGDDYKEEVYNLVLADEGLDKATLYARDGTFSADAVLTAMRSNVHLINHMGHGNFGYMAGLTNEKVRKLDNSLPFILYTQACMVAGFDEKPYAPGDCIAEEFVQGRSGAVAFIGNSRYGWYSPGNTAGSSQKFDISFFSKVYDHGITDLGRALSYSKEDWFVQASTAGTMRWVYLGLNLLGDPETRVHLPSRALHDLSVEEVVTSRALLGETCSIAVEVQNKGQSEENGALTLFVNTVNVGNATVSLAIGESAVISFDWTPEELGVAEILVRITCQEDIAKDNDQMSKRVMVDRRVSVNETWEGAVALLGGLLIDPGVTVRATDCDIDLVSSPIAYRLSVEGSLIMENCTMRGSPFMLDAPQGLVEISDCRLIGMSEGTISRSEGGVLSIKRTTVLGGSGWRTNGTSVLLSDLNLQDQTGEWSLFNSSVLVERLVGIGGSGIHLYNASGSMTHTSWKGGERGLSVERCIGLTLHDLEMTGNEMDMGIYGDDTVHFRHDVERVYLTCGPLSLVQGMVGGSIAGASGSLYLIDCHDVTVSSSRFCRAGCGLALIGCSGIEVIGNAIENCTIGLLALDSEGIVWGNDMLFNLLQAREVRSSISFSAGYPVGGNHWSDMEGIDLKGGVLQDQPGSDGVFDSPYDDGHVYDPYPKVACISFHYDRPKAVPTCDRQITDRINVVTFGSASQSGIGISNWTWDLGDGRLAYGPWVQHTYTSLGVFNVSLTITDHKGLNDTSTIGMRVVNLAPEAAFIYSPQFPAPGTVVRFQDLSLDLDGHLVRWSWDFGDGWSSSQQSPEHTFIDEGRYLVTLTVQDEDGASDGFALLVAIGNEPPTASFSWYPSPVTTVVDVTFTSLSTDADGAIVSWDWRFGDGSIGSGPTVRHRYSAIGTYDVSLTVTDEYGASSSIVRSLTVVNSKPVAAFEAPARVDSLIEVAFVDLSYDLDGEIRSWSWEFGDGSRSGESSPSHTYLRAGTYQVNLTVIDDRGSIAKASKSITVSNRLPELNATVPEGPHWSLEVLAFSALGRDADGTIVGYVWDMGDGVVMMGADVTHAYMAPGDYLVSVICRDDCGGQTGLNFSLRIMNLDPRAEVRVRTGDHPLEVVLTAEAEDYDGFLTSYDWSLGDGTFATGPSIVHRYLAEGAYSVSLTVKDDAGGMDSVGTLVVVRKVNISLSDPSVDHLEGVGWVLSGEVVNEGELPVKVVIQVDAGGLLFYEHIEVDGSSSSQISIELTDFHGGRIETIVLTPEDWDADDTDNAWTATVEGDRPADTWMIWFVVPIVIIVAMAAYIRRRS